jgi:predicted nucleic acid-binding protein
MGRLRRLQLRRTGGHQPGFTIVPVTDDEVEAAADLLREHPEYSIGAGDAIHLVTALAVTTQTGAASPLVFVTADRGLAAAARENGFAVFNPLDQEMDELERITTGPGG